MNTDITYDLDQLDNLTTQLHNLAKFLNEHLATLDQKVAALHTGGSWDGVAAAAHRSAHDEWSSSAAEFTAAVETMRDAARHAHAQYTAAQTVNTKMFRR